MNSFRLAEGSVGHARPGKNGNRFRYPLFSFCFPLALENDFFSLLRKRFRPYFGLRAKDYLGGQAGSFADSALRFLQTEVGVAPDEIELQTMPRILGYGFNPINFWWCEENKKALGTLCEVNNTFGERHCYWIPAAAADAEGWARAEKIFHVSPFFPVDGYYRFRFQRTEENFRVDITHHEESGALRLATWLEGTYRPLEESSAVSLLAKYGWMTALVMARIHYQAFRLFLRRHRFFRKPLPPSRKVSS